MRLRVQTPAASVVALGSASDALHARVKAARLYSLSIGEPDASELQEWSEDVAAWAREIEATVPAEVLRETYARCSHPALGRVDLDARDAVRQLALAWQRGLSGRNVRLSA